MKFNPGYAFFGFCLSSAVAMFIAAIICVTNGLWAAAGVLAFLICVAACLISGFSEDAQKEVDEDWFKNLVKETVQEVLDEEL